MFNFISCFDNKVLKIEKFILLGKVQITKILIGKFPYSITVVDYLDSPAVNTKTRRAGVPDSNPGPDKLFFVDILSILILTIIYIV